MRGIKSNVSFDEVYNLYFNKRMSVGETCKVLHICDKTMKKILAEHGLTTRSHGTPLYERKYLDKDWLYNQYIVLDKTFEQIGQEFGYGSTTIETWVKNHNIPVKSLSYYLKGRIFKPETLKAMSKAKIGVFAGSKNVNWKGGISPQL